LKSLLSNDYSTFLIYVNFVIFIYRKLQAEKKWKNFFSLYRSIACPKKIWVNFLSWEAFPTKSFFKNVSTIFCFWVTCKLSKKEHSDFIAHNSVQNHRIAIKNRDF